MDRNVVSAVEHHGRVTMVRLVDAEDSALYAEGTALRSKADVPCDAVGELIALGRALQTWGAKVEAAGHAACVTKEEADRVAWVMDARAKEREARKAEK